MFEGISRRSNGAPSRSRIALATALGLHAAVFIGATLYAQLGTEERPATLTDGVVTFYRKPVTRLSGRQETTKETTTKDKPKSRPLPRKPPRALPSDPASLPKEPEQLAAPVDPSDTRAADEPGPIPGSGPLGTGDAGDENSGAESARCPAGAVCSSSGGEDVLTFSSSMKRPRANCNPPAPLAPQAASQFGLEGRVVAQYVVHADGRADAVSILNSDAPPVFVEAVRSWVEQCSFTPAEVDGSAHSVRIIQAFRFKSR